MRFPSGIGNPNLKKTLNQKKLKRRKEREVAEEYYVAKINLEAKRLNMHLKIKLVNQCLT